MLRHPPLFVSAAARCLQTPVAGHEKGPGVEPGAFSYSLARQSDSTISRIRAAVSDGVLPTLTPAASRASFFA